MIKKTRKARARIRAKKKARKLKRLPPKINARLYTYKNYPEYLKTEWWQWRRNLYWSKHKRICYCCGDPARDLHHCSYRRLGSEWDSDLIPLCRYCHGKVHELIKSSSYFKIGYNSAHTHFRYQLNNK